MILTIAEQVAQMEPALASATVIELATPGTWDGQQAPTQAGHRPWQRGEHRREAEAALHMWEDACDHPGGEYTGWHNAVSALIHALLDLGERMAEQ